MDIKAVRKAVSKIKTNLFRRSNSYSIGALKSHFRGSGLQFKEHRVYTPGDEIRFIDWKMLAKTSHPYVKTFEEERNVEIVVVIDASVTMLYGYNKISKLQAAIEICCLLYILAQETGDKVHVLVMGNELINIPKKSGEEGIAALIYELQRSKILNEKAKVNLEYKNTQVTYEKKIENLTRHLKFKRELVLLSDFIDFIPEEYLEKVIYRKNVHAFQVLSPIDCNSKKPFMLPFKTFDRGTTGLGYIYSDRRKENNALFKGHLRVLHVEEDYLDKFIKDML